MAPLGLLTASVGLILFLGGPAVAVSSKPVPPTAKKAIALVRANPDTTQAASPYQRELGWSAAWRGDRWWVVGVFKSQWGKRFAVDAAIIAGKVRTYIYYYDRPPAKWV